MWYNSSCYSRILLYLFHSAYIDDMKIYTFSMSAALPAIDGSNENIPAFLRIVTRGRAFEVRSDISNLELFSVSTSGDCVCYLCQQCLLPLATVLVTSDNSACHL